MLGPQNVLTFFLGEQLKGNLLKEIIQVVDKTNNKIELSKIKYI